MTLRLSFILALLTAVVLAGCGGSSTETSSPASSSTDVNALLKDTFANLSKVKSANLDTKLGVQGQGDSVSAQLHGPFESQGTGKLPKFQLDATLNSAGKSFTAGATWTGDKGFVNVQGTQYALSGLVAKQLQAGYEQAMQKNQGKSAGNAATLGIDFSKWLKNGTNAGDSQAGGVDTIKITGDADVPQIVDDLQKVTEKASSLGLGSGTSVPQKLTPQQRQQLIDAIKKVSIEVYTGKADRILRRIVVNADIAAASEGNATLTFDLTLNQVGQKQTITEPKNAKPFSELAKLAGQLKSSLGSLGALAGGSSSSSGGSSGTAPSSANIEKYAKCIQKAQGDSTKAQKCADLLTG